MCLSSRFHFKWPWQCWESSCADELYPVHQMLEMIIVPCHCFIPNREDDLSPAKHLHSVAITTSRTKVMILLETPWETSETLHSLHVWSCTETTFNLSAAKEALFFILLLPLFVSYSCNSAVIRYTHANCSCLCNHQSTAQVFVCFCRCLPLHSHFFFTVTSHYLRWWHWLAEEWTEGLIRLNGAAITEVTQNKHIHKYEKLVDKKKELHGALDTLVFSSYTIFM